MPKLAITAESSGLTELIDDLDRLITQYPEVTEKAFEAQQQVIEDAVRLEWVKVGGEYGGRIYESVGHSTKKGEGVTFGTVGVYKIDSIEAQFGRTDKDLNAAQIAYWVENGTSRLRLGGRKKKGREYLDEELITIAAKPFISRAYFNTIDEQEQAFANEWNLQIDKVMK